MTAQEYKDDRRLAAPCGLYCGACVIRSAVKKNDPQFIEFIADGLARYLGHPVGVEEVDCDGCLSAVRAAPCRECEIRDCAAAKGIVWCSQCPDFPCQVITDFNNDEFDHHSEVLDNIRRQQEVGIDGWIGEQEQRWRCPQCGQPTDWYTAQCASCGADLDDHF
jgi:hypothetical protein